MIALSAGHYPESRGACWPPDPSPNQVCEHEIASKWVGRVAAIVREQAPVVLVPSTNLYGKVGFINKLKGCKLAVEIHFNSAASAKARGSETLFCPGSHRGKRSADIVQGYISKVFPPDRGVKEGWHRADIPGQVDYVGDVEGDEKIVAFLKDTNPVALVVEPEFIFNQVTIEKLEVAGCAALAKGIVMAYMNL